MNIKRFVLIGIFCMTTSNCTDFTSIPEKKWSLWDRIRLYAKSFYNPHDEEWLRFYYAYPYQTRTEFLLTLTTDELADLDAAVRNRLEEFNNLDQEQKQIKRLSLEDLINSKDAQSFYHFYTSIMSKRAKKDAYNKPH